MLPKDLTGDAAKADSFERYVLQNAIGPILILDAAPTTAGGQLREGMIGIYSTNLYLTVSGTTYRISLTAV